MSDRAPAEAAGRAPEAQFWPLGLTLSRGFVPVSSSIPRAQRLVVYRDGLDVRNLFQRAWIPRDRIVDLYRIPVGFRVVWEDGDLDCMATVSAWFGTNKIVTAMEQAGYRFEHG